MKNTVLTFGFLVFWTVSVFGQFQVNNNAVALGGGYYRLTQALNSQSGSVWYKLQHDLTDPLNIQGRMYFGTDNAGADGIAFVLQNNCLAAGTSGGGIGYAGMPGQSIAVEFDTYENISGSGDQNNNDPAYDHLAIEKAGNVDHANATNNLFGPIQMHSTKTNVEDNLWYDFQISYDPITMELKVYFDNTLRVTYTNDLKTNIFGGNQYVYWGFTASTGGFFNEQQVYINGSLSTYTITDMTTCASPVSVTLPPLTKFTGTNIALNKTAVATSNEHAGVPPSATVDGNMSSRWSSAYSDAEWIYVDLGSAHDVDSVVLYWEGAYGKQYKIQTSTDATTWTDQYTETNSNGGKDKIVFTATNVRYVRMFGIQRAIGYGYSLWEFQVYGKPKYIWSPNDGSISDIYSPTPTFTPAVTTMYTVIIPDPCSGPVTYNMTVTVDCSSLPASLLSFDAVRKNEHTMLDWTTSQEVNTDYFTVLRSVDGIYFTAIGLVQALGNSSSIHSYSFEDSAPVSGTVYYKLIVSDTDGNTAESEVKSVSANSSNILIGNSVFEDEVAVLLSEKTDWISITVLDLLGRTLIQLDKENVSGEILLGSTLAPACYLLKVQTTTSAESFKITKTK